ncbi:MAG TPA: zinc metalloprotease [Nocardioides bacterium]|nr:zinc metalloprotease [Nocardioides sp.]
MWGMRVSRSKKSVAALATGGAVLALGLVGPASPVTAGVGAASAASAGACPSGHSDARQRGGGDGTDPNSVTAAQTAAMEQQLQAGIAALPRQARKAARQLVLGKRHGHHHGHHGHHPRLPKHVKINTYVHVITQSDGAGDVTNAQIRQQMKVINDGFKGKTSPTAAWTPFKFVLKSIDRTANDDWYDWGYPGDEETPPTDTDDEEAKTALHRGGWADLNVYIAGLGDGLLGYATFPDEGDLKLDGLVLLNDSLPGGAAAPYNEGDTATHEIGHWLYLLHTFENGCNFPGDEVPDTAYQNDGDNIFECDEALDTCAQPGTDPVHNFMSYGDDPCLDEFTKGQSLRMTYAWLVFRAGR